MARSGIVLVNEMGEIALIERRRGGDVYYLLPGGQVDDGEALVDAAAREAFEELGVIAEVDRLVAEVDFGGREQYYFAARIVGGVFGSGDGPELSSEASSARGSYRPAWWPLSRIDEIDCRPRELLSALARSRSGEWPAEPLRFLDVGVRSGGL